MQASFLFTTQPAHFKFRLHNFSDRVVSFYTSKTYNIPMLTIIETPTFQRLWPAYWTEEERAEFAAYLAQFPEAGDVVKGSGGVRKVRWARQGGGKSGGVRVIYYNRLASGEVVLIFVYAKNEFDSIAGEKLKELKNAIEKAYGR